MKEKKILHIRNVSAETVRLIAIYAAENDISRAEAIEQLVKLALELPSS